MIATDANVLYRQQSTALQRIADKVYSGERISEEEGIMLFEKGSLPFVGALANHMKEKLHGVDGRFSLIARYAKIYLTGIGFSCLTSRGATTRHA